MSLTLLVCVFVEVGLAVDKNSPRRGGIAEHIGESLEARRFLAWLSCQRPAAAGRGAAWSANPYPSGLARWIHPRPRAASQAGALKRFLDQIATSGDHPDSDI